MDQIIGYREAEKNIINEIRRDYDITVRHEEAGNRTSFLIQNGGAQSGLELVSRMAAVRRNLPVFRAGRVPCMADIDRVETGLIGAVEVNEAYRQNGFTEKLMTGALAYQHRMQVPLCLAENPDADFFGRFGFQDIYDRPHYVLNTGTISMEMLTRAARGERVRLDLPGLTLQAVAPEELLSLAHFVNARLCRSCGFFTIRSAAYYESEQKKLQDSGGNLFQIMENGVRRGCFACTDTRMNSVREVVFDPAFDKACYILTEKAAEKGSNPAVMARIVNMSEMLKHVAGDGRITIAIRVHDPVIAENDGLFIWYIDENGSRMERVEETAAAKGLDASMRPEVTVPVGELTAFLFAHTRLKPNAKFDSIYLTGPAWLDDIY